MTLPLLHVSNRSVRSGCGGLIRQQPQKFLLTMAPAKHFHPVSRTWRIVTVWRGQQRFERENLLAPLDFRRFFQRQSNGIEPLQHLQFVDDLRGRWQINSPTEPSVLAHGR